LSILEESITDFNLLDLQIRHPQEIVTQKFSKRREAKEGADWEWWLGSEGFWLALRVQAKIVDAKTLRYSHLAYKSPRNPQRQIDLLISYSVNGNPPKIPIYVFYNYWNVNAFDPPWLCPTYSKVVEMLGCGVSEAITVRSILNQGSDALQDIARVMYPWSCLVCCRGFSREDERLPFRAFNFFLGAYGRYIKEAELPLFERNRFVLEKAPSYVYKILEGQRLSEEEWSKIEVNRITVIYERGEKKQKVL